MNEHIDTKEQTPSLQKYVVTGFFENDREDHLNLRLRLQGGDQTPQAEELNLSLNF